MQVIWNGYKPGIFDIPDLPIEIPLSHKLNYGNEYKYATVQKTRITLIPKDITKNPIMSNMPLYCNLSPLCVTLKVLKTAIPDWIKLSKVAQTIPFTADIDTGQFINDYINNNRAEYINLTGALFNNQWRRWAAEDALSVLLLKKLIDLNVITVKP